MDDYNINDTPCPKCGNGYTHDRPCQGMNCDDGYCDEYEDDPINFAPGEEYTECEECHGTGWEHWCPKCGYDLTLTASDHQPNAQSQRQTEAAEKGLTQ